ncbi:MAG: hypothetical protein D6769_03325, partial [Methanobacteriota archaeon]
MKAIKPTQHSKKTKKAGFPKKDVLEERIKALELRIKDCASGRAREDVLNTLNSILSSKNFTQELIPAIQEIAEKTQDWTAFWAFSALLSFTSKKGFQASWIEDYWNPLFATMVSNTLREGREAAFVYLTLILSDKNFTSSWLGQPSEQLAMHLSTIFNTITKKTFGKAREEAFSILNAILLNKNFQRSLAKQPAELFGQFSKIFKEITCNVTPQSVQLAFHSLGSLLHNDKFTPDLLQTLV